MLADPAMGTQLKEEASPSADDMSNNSAIHRSLPLATNLPVGDDGSRHGGSLMRGRERRVGGGRAAGEQPAGGRNGPGSPHPAPDRVARPRIIGGSGFR